MNRYVMLFAAANLLLTIVVAVLAEIFKLKSGAGFTLAAVMGAGFYAAWAFDRDHGRPPTDKEKQAFAWRSLLSTWLVSLALTALAAAVFMDPSELGAVLGVLKSGPVMAIGIGASVIISGIYYLAIRWSFGWYSKQARRPRK